MSSSLLLLSLLKRCSSNGLQARLFSRCPQHLDKALPPRRKISEDEIIESFLKGSGPGGQKINKTSSAVQLKHIPTGIVVKSQETRSRQQNRKLARQILSEKLDVIEKGSDSRTAIKVRQASAKKASASKKTRRKYKKLAEEKDETKKQHDEVADDNASIVNEGNKATDKVMEVAEG